MSARGTDRCEVGRPDGPSILGTVGRLEQRLDCLEVWGGSDGIDSAVRVTGLDVWAWSQPADSVAGGDLYLVSMCACAEVSRFLIADVTGHDAEAAQVANRLRKLMRKHINKPDQTRLAWSLNRDFDGMARHGKFATAVLATFFPPSRHLILCNAGHPAPLLYRAAERQWVSLDPRKTSAAKEVSNLPLGVANDSPYGQFAVRLARDDLVLIYTDGLTERRTDSGEMLGEAGLIERIGRLDGEDPHRLLPSLRATLGITADEGAKVDDMTALLLGANGEQPPRQSITQKIRVTAKMLGLLPSSRHQSG
jgi:serine phosphatase RsbU (regulator of sigma subunit)